MRVVPALDPFEQGHSGLGFRLEPAMLEQLFLERSEHALGHGVVVGVAHRAHRRHHVHLLAAFAERVARILATVVRVVNDVLWSPLGQRQAAGVGGLLQLPSSAWSTGRGTPYERLLAKTRAGVSPA